MRPFKLLLLSVCWFSGVAGWAGGAEAAGPASVANLVARREPVITDIWLEGSDVVVVVAAPIGLKKLTLEGSQRLGRPDWSPKAVARLDGNGGEVTFRLARSPDIQMLRVKGDNREALPASFYQGATSFDGQPLDLHGPASTRSDFTGSSGGSTIAFNNLLLGSSPGSVDSVASRTVAESDIWKVHGDTLYFFNQYRGLQVIDLGVPDAPVIRGTLPLAAVGEQMYLLGPNHVVLLTRDGCNRGNDTESQVLLVQIVEGKPRQVAAVPVKGYIKESRLVGNALYVASEAYQKLGDATAPGGGERWEWGTSVSAFDLSQPDQPVVRSTDWVASSGSVVTATDRLLFVAGLEDGVAGGLDRNVVHVFDISSPDGTFQRLCRIHPAGRVMDKFKMNFAGDVFTVVSESLSGIRATHVETFSLAEPNNPQRLGSLKVIENESLFATRFDGNRLYVVTFRRIDPLWVIDLANPAQPVIAGELQVPGWSTYIHPLGDRLLAVGVDNTGGSRVAVSLFDVRDPAHPALLSRVSLGEHHSSSEASFDEKALGVFPDSELALVPYSAWTTNGYVQRVQLVDLTSTALALRGVIEHEMEGRRATIHRDRILSISGRELLSVDTTDRDQPRVRSRTELAWPVDRVFVAGPHLLELARSHDSSGGPQVRVADAEDPNRVLNLIRLSDLPYLGAAFRDNRLYVAQGRPSQMTWVATAETSGQVATNPGVFKLTILDLARLPDISVAGEVEVETESTVMYPWKWEAVWPKPGLVVWHPVQNGGYWGPPYRTWDPLPLQPIFTTMEPWGTFPAAGFVTVTSPLLWSGGVGFPAIFRSYDEGERLIAFDVSDPAQPGFASDVRVGGENRTPSGGAFAADGLVFLGHHEYESEIVRTNYSVWTNAVTEWATNVATVTNYTRVPQQVTVTNVEIRTNVTTIAMLNRLGSSGGGSWPDGARRNGAIAMGWYHSLALDPSGGAWSWGGNGHGQLGDGTLADRPDARPVPLLEGVDSLAAGHFHNLALRSDGTVHGWGSDTFGQLGRGPPPPPLPGFPPLPYSGSSSPVCVSGLTEVVAVAAGGYHSLALKADGTVQAWGANFCGQLGDQTRVGRDGPLAVSGLSNVVTVAGGAFHSLAVADNGTVWVWGRNNFGQLGNGTNVDSDRPIVVEGFANAVAVAGGLWHSLAVRSDGAVFAWGNNDSNQVTEAGTMTHRPALVPHLDGVVAVTAGLAHNLALKADGTVWAWGLNDHQQLGDGTTASRGRPRPVIGLAGAIAIAAGGNTSLALTADGTVWAWGENGMGQLGHGEPVTVTTTEAYTNVFTETTFLWQTNVVLQTNHTQITRFVAVTNAMPVTQWYQHHYLDVVDYAAATEPVVRAPVNLPGALHGVARDGALLHTIGRRAATEDATNPVEWLDVSAYDGVDAHLVDSLRLPSEGPRPVLMHGDAVILGRPASDTNSSPRLEVWTLPDTGKFEPRGVAALGTAATRIEAFDNLLVVQGASELLLLNATDLSTPTLIGRGDLPGCIGFDVSDGDGSVEGGFWLPIGGLGVKQFDAGADQPAP